jgi:hypothetical protein
MLWVMAALEAFGGEMEEASPDSADGFRTPLMQRRIVVPRLDPAPDLMHAIERRLEVDELLLKHSEPDERWAALLSRRQTVHVSLDPASEIEVATSGGASGLRVHVGPLSRDDATLRRRLRLSPVEGVDRVLAQPQRDDHPVFARLSQHRRTMQDFNMAMSEHGYACRPARVVLDSRGLASALQRAAKRMFDLSTAFAEEFADLGASRPKSEQLLMVVALEPPGHTVVGHRSSGALAQQPREQGGVGVCVKVVEGITQEVEMEGWYADEDETGYRDVNSNLTTTVYTVPPRALETTFGLTSEQSDETAVGSLPLRLLVAILLGFESDDDIEFVWPKGKSEDPVR